MAINLILYKSFKKLLTEGPQFLMFKKVVADGWIGIWHSHDHGSIASLVTKTGNSLCYVKIKINPLYTNIKYKFTHKFTHKCYWIEKLKELINFRCLPGVLEGVFVLKLKAKCEPSTARKTRENLRAKTQVSEIFQITFHFKARTEESTILLVRIKKNWWQIYKKISWPLYLTVSQGNLFSITSIFMPQITWGFVQTAQPPPPPLLCTWTWDVSAICTSL